MHLAAAEGRAGFGGATILDEEGRTASRTYAAKAKEVLIVLVQSDPPGEDQAGIELGLDEKRYVGLPADRPSFAIVSEANIDSWPNADMGLVPGRRDRFAYDRPLSQPTLSRLVKAFLIAVEQGVVQILVRQP